MNVMEMLEMLSDADSLEHPAGIRRVAVGKDKAASGKPGQQPGEPLVALHPLQWYIVDVFEEAGVDAALAASVFHSGTIAIPDLKTTLAASGIEVRL